MTSEQIKKIILTKGIFSEKENLRIYFKVFQNWVKYNSYIFKRFNINFEDKILDIGSNYGYNLIHFNPDSVGIESAKSMADFSKALGLNVLDINIEDDLAVVGKFDLIWCLDFLVHMASPYKFLYDCRRLLPVGGKIVIQIPLMSIFNKHRSGCHFYAFNKKSLLYLIEMAGFRVIKTSGLIRKKPEWFNFIFELMMQNWGGNIWVLAEKEDKAPVDFKKVYLPDWFKA